MKARLLQICFQLGVFVDGHAADDLCLLLVLTHVAVCFITDAECSTGLQNPINLPETLRQFRPKVHSLKSCRYIKAAVCKDHIRHASLQNGAAALRNRRFVDVF